MIPNHTWSPDQTIKPYLTYSSPKPNYPSTPTSVVSLGPKLELSTTWSSDNSGWWLIKYDKDTQEVTASLFVDAENAPEFHSVLFTLPECKRLSATFDQNGKPAVFFDTGSELRLWWYDPVLGAVTTSVFGEGSYPFAVFDLKYGVGTSYSDVLLFYVRDGAIFYRVQRDRYAIEYATPVTADAVFIKEADMAVDYRLQLLYRYRDTGFTPPEPTPPIVAPDTGYFAYLLTGYQSAVEIEQAGAFTLESPFSVAFDLDNVAYLNVQSTLFSYGNEGQNPIVSVVFSGQDRDILEVRYFGFKHVKKLDFPLQDGHWLIEFYRVDGVGFNHALRVSCLPKGSATALVYEFLLLSPAVSTVGKLIRIGNRASYGEQIFTVPSDFSSSFTTRNEYAFGLRGAISNIELHTAIEGAPVIKLPMVKAQNEAQTLLDAMGLPLPFPAARINDYKSANWQFVKL